MRSQPWRHDKATNDTKASANGDAVKSFSFYEGDLCPGCPARPIEAMKIKARMRWHSMRLSTAPGVLIDYFLCQKCATYMFDEAQKHPYKETPLVMSIQRPVIVKILIQRLFYNFGLSWHVIDSIL
jgi:hypothetical protein